jgi:glycosyltransferase involved in cell wall biosynthesis
MTATLPPRTAARAPIAVAPGGPPVVDVVIPVYNEERDLVPSVRRLHLFLEEEFPLPARITIVDNASTDATWPLARMLADDLPGVRAIRLEEKGRGRALRAAWETSDAPVLAYMDVDLSTDLAGLLPLVAPLVSGHSDVAIGSRRARGARTVRGAKRELLSRGYNVLLRTTLRTRFSDAQCGFKALRADAARELLPRVEDPAWFFDTELLVLAERAGMRIHEVPVDWVDDPDSRVDIRRTVLDDLRGILRIGPELWRQVGRFALIGVASTLAYVLIYLALRGAMGAQAANLLALLVTAVGNTAANRRITFGVRGRTAALRHQVEGLGVFALGLVLTSGALAALHAASPSPPRSVEVAVLVVANAAATLARFVLLRSWVFRPGREDAAPAPLAIDERSPA